MSVPFEQIGPGQVGRHVFQVIGKDGPIFNPSNIAYLRPEEASSPIFDPHGALAGIAGLNLAASVGACALSATVLHEVRQMQSQLAEISEMVGEMAVTLNDVQRRVQRIDTRVSETHLREAFRHLVSASIQDGNIDLKRLTPLIDDIGNLEETVEDGLLFNFGIRLSSDLREHLNSLCSLLFGIRRNIVGLHNCAVAFEPERWVQNRRFDDYLRPGTLSDIVQFAIVCGRAKGRFFEFQNTLGDSVYNHFTLADEADREHFKQMALDQCLMPQLSAFYTMPASGKGADLSVVLDRIGFEYSDEEVYSKALDVALLWLYETDGSLLFRLKAELEGIRDGYAERFYPELCGEPDVPIDCPAFALSASAA